MDLGVVPPLMRIGSILKNVHEWKVHMAINGAKRDIEVSSEHGKCVCVITDLLSWKDRSMPSATKFCDNYTIVKFKLKNTLLYASM